MRTLKYGGDLRPGDFIAISESNTISFGWYFGDGIGGTLQYYYLGSPEYHYNTYQDWNKITDSEVKKKHWRAKTYSKGFTLKCIHKSYINAVHSTRVVKITNPEDIFTETKDRETYEKSKETLEKSALFQEQGASVSEDEKPQESAVARVLKANLANLAKQAK